MSLTLTRKQRLRTLENNIRHNYEAFVATGFALKEIRDDELFKEDGFETWEAYLGKRVGQDFGIERTQAYKLIACAQIRTKLPDPPTSTTVDVDDEKSSWSQSAVLEFGRLASPVQGKATDFDSLDKRDVNRVAKKVIEHCEETGTKPTATIVRKFVDEELGVDRSAKVAATKQRDDDRPTLEEYIGNITGRIEGALDALKTIPVDDADTWKLLIDERPQLVKRLITACTSMAEFLRGLDDAD